MNKIAQCNQYLVVRTNIATIRLVAECSIATKHLAAIFHGCHERMCCSIEVLSLQNYVGVWSYCHEVWSIALQWFCSISDMVAIDDMIMQRISLRGNIWKLQRICVGGNREHMQQTLLVAIDDMVMQRIKFVTIIHIATKINSCLLFYRNERILNSSF
jgi:hypothetical protein